MQHPRLLVLIPILALTGCSALTDLLGPGIPNPFQGEDTLLLELRCDPTSAAAASNLVGARLTLLDLRHSVTAHPSGTLSITTTNAAQGQVTALASLLTAPPDLGFHAVLDDQAPLRPRHDPPEEAVLDALPTLGGRPDLAFDVEAMQAMLALAGGPLPPVEGVRIAERFDEREVYAAPAGADWQPWLSTLALPQGAAVVTECWQEQDEQLCSPLLVEEPPPVTAANIEGTRLGMDQQGISPHLELSFDAAGQQAFFELSERLVGHYLAIVSDGRVLSRPMVAEPIPGGRAWLTVGYGLGEPELLDLWRYHAVLETGPLPGACTVQASERVP